MVDGVEGVVEDDEDSGTTSKLAAGIETKKTALVRDPETLWMWIRDEGQSRGSVDQPWIFKSSRRSSRTAVANSGA
jgi:hypothetical protein